MSFTSRFGLTSMVAGTKPLLHAVGGEGLERYLLLSAWPAGWLQRYSKQNYLWIDPVIRRIQSEPDAFLWSEAASGDLEPAARTMFGEAAEFGLKAGFTVPMLTLDGAFAAVSLGGPAVELPPEARGMLSLISIFAAGRAIELHNRGSHRKLTKLTAREVECLQWAADGKSEWEIGQILGISEHTVDRHMANARRKLGARTRTQAIAAAMRLGLIS